MTLDDDLLADVRRARARLDELEDEAWQARDRFHAAVRRLHGAGGSLREIAQVLAMSHQRVHQIVGGDGIVEVQPPAPAPPAPAAPEADPARCSFCTTAAPGRLLTSPGRALVCDTCVASAVSVLEGSETNVAVAGGRHLRRGTEARPCSFCRTSGARRPQAELDDGTARICSTCAERCGRVLAARRGGPPEASVKARRSAMRCSFCNAPKREVVRMIAGPGVCICDACIRLGAAVASGAEARALRRAALITRASDEPHACQFCRKMPAVVDGNQMVKGGRGRICGACLQRCADALADEGVTT